MAKDLFYPHFDLVTPDGKITKLEKKADGKIQSTISIDGIAPSFVGFKIDKKKILFNLKSTLAQLGLNAECKDIELSFQFRHAEVTVLIYAINKLGQSLLNLLTEGAYVGKLFAADDRRRVRNPEYLLRMFGRSDNFGRPLLSLGMHGSSDLILEKIEGRTVAFLTLQDGILEYDESIYSFLPTLAKALFNPCFPLREIIKLHQVWISGKKKTVKANELLLVKTLPLHIRTVFGKVVDSLLPQGAYHTNASVLQPDTMASGDVYELYGSSKKELTDIPLEFYTLEPYREHVFFSDRDQLIACLEDPKYLFEAFKTSPGPAHYHSAVFVVKGEQLMKLTPDDWISEDPYLKEFPGFLHGERQGLVVQKYIQALPAYPFLEAIQEEWITSQGILLTRFFPSPLLKRMLLSERVQRCLKRIYFSLPSRSYGDYFSHEDRSLLIDLAKFGIPVYWVDETTKQILQYTPRPDKDTGMFVPISQVENFTKSTMIGVYGSNLSEGNFEAELKKLLEGLLQLKKEVTHFLLSPKTPLSLVTGGGPGVMKVGNKVAKELGILSCANLVDFSNRNGGFYVNEQLQNPYIEAKMTYRLDKLVERQAEFNLDLPIFLAGGIGTDFEFALEEVRRKVGVGYITPVLLFGRVDYWKQKITSRFLCNREMGTIQGSEWVSNCFFCIQTAQQGLDVYRKFFSGQLLIGKNAPIQPDGFTILAPLESP